MRIGHGFDAHCFGESKNGASIILGGVNIPFEKPLVAHSDGDVVLHALCDALLGAAGLGDIGKHFPDSSAEFKGISSRILLQRVKLALNEKKFAIGNVDITVVAQAPKLAAHIGSMKQNIGEDLSVSTDQVNVKATTTEGMGFTGRGEGIAVHAVALITEIT